MIKDKAGAKSKYCSINAVRGTKTPLGEMQSFNQSSSSFFVNETMGMEEIF